VQLVEVWGEMSVLTGSSFLKKSEFTPVTGMIVHDGMQKWAGDRCNIAQKY